MENNKRDFLKKLGLGALSTTGFSTITAAEKGIEEPVETLAVQVAENSERNVLAFTATEENTLCLHLAIGTDSIEEPADKIISVTDPTNGSVMSPSWESSSDIEYWQNGAVRRITVDGNGNVEGTTVVKEKQFPDGMSILSEDSQSSTASSNQTIEPEAVVRPDWMDDPQYDHPRIQRCSNAEFGEVCVGTTSISPKFYTDCTGNEVPLVGASLNAASITTPGGGFSISTNIWAGVNPVTECLYWGSSLLDACEKECFNSFPPSQAELENRVIDSLIASLEQLSGDIPGWVKTTISTIFQVLAVVAVLIFLAFIQIASGGGIGS